MVYRLVPTRRETASNGVFIGCPPKEADFFYFKAPRKQALWLVIVSEGDLGMSALKKQHYIAAQRTSSFDLCHKLNGKSAATRTTGNLFLLKKHDADVPLLPLKR